ncbi:MAG: phytase [Porticoccaceae bacterium]|nr:phytase [Porticoccaceae bacterium]
MKPLATVALILLAQLGASPQLASADTPTLATRPLQINPGNGEDVVALPTRPGAWLIASATKGLVLVAENGEQYPLQAGKFEALDARAGLMVNGKAETLISAIDRDSGAIVLFALDDATDNLRNLAAIDSATALPETQCLYRDPQEGHLSLFAVDTQGMVHQHIIYDNRRQALVNIAVRSFIGATDSQACAVDDNTGSLYLAEEGLGVWRYAANPETDASRQPVALVSPHGAVAGEIADIAVADSGELWVLSAEPARIQRYSGKGLVDDLALDQMEEAKSLAVARHGDTLLLSIYDESADNYQMAELTADSPAAAPAAATVPRIYATGETAAVARFGDAADDPAIWLNPRKPRQSLIIGTDKREGLKIYGLDGELRQSLNIGRLNNVDLIANSQINGKRQPLIAASNRNLNSISLFTIARGNRVKHLGDITTNLDEVYGLCMYQSASGDYVFINDTDGRYQQYRIGFSGAEPRGELVRQFSLPSQPEGCTVDANANRLYMGEEKAGIWATHAEPAADAPLKMIIAVDDHLVADVEGMEIYFGADRHYLVVSSQGNDSYVVYGLWGDYPKVTHFRIAADLERGIDGASETDGLTVTASPLPGYPQGLLVVQDGRNRMPDQPQNFKLVDWRQIQTLIDGSADRQQPQKLAE